MATLRGNRNSAIGLFVDGLELRCAKLSLKRGNVVLEELQTAQLATKLEDRHAASGELEALGESIDTFALPTSTEAVQ